MDYKEASSLQEHIEATYPYIGITLKQIGDQDEWICYLDTAKYFLWNSEDWPQYEQTRKEYLTKYTEEGHERLRAHMRNRAKNRKRTKQIVQQLKTGSQVSS